MRFMNYVNFILYKLFLFDVYYFVMNCGLNMRFVCVCKFE